jgi:acyl carrier protein
VAARDQYQIESLPHVRPSQKLLHVPLILSLFRFSMLTEQLHDDIKEMMIENLMLKVSKEEIGDSLPLFGAEGLGLDSIDALELVVSLEKKFGVTIPNSQVAREVLATVNSIHDYVVANRKE